ncbi:DUF2161 family putative PD-(D/E)XK-type phosphodiesterase [Paeniroseomonas aquatica]|uniref:DUF2161 family putative PD-(D/E)XK-type phosphodiesterase n=1 Tax=Paeniroseomonas aquatica TaxID=373043 RepID=UPI003616CFC2
MELILQGVDRLAAPDEVWLAVLATRRGRDRDRRAPKLCRLLGFGLLAVDPARQAVEVLAEPAPYRPRPNAKRRSRLVQEHRRRQGDPTEGGASRQPIITAYWQRALACATAMAAGPVSTQTLRTIAPDAGTLMLRNVYGWFERESRGVSSDRIRFSGVARQPGGPRNVRYRSLSLAGGAIASPVSLPSHQHDPDCTARFRHSRLRAVAGAGKTGAGEPAPSTPSR